MCGSWRKVPSNKDVPDAHCAISILDKTVNKYFKFVAAVCTLVLTASTASYAKGGGVVVVAVEGPLAEVRAHQLARAREQRNLVRRRVDRLSKREGRLCSKTWIRQHTL